MSFYSEISVLEKLDGVVICSNSLDFYEKPIGTLVVKHPFMISPMEVNSFKCCEVIQKYQFVFPVKLSEILGLQLYVAFGSNSSYVSYQLILERFEAAYDATMKALDSTTTKSCWCSLLLAHKRKSEQSFIFAEDIYAFGHLLIFNLHQQVVSVIEEIESACFVLSGMGQSCSVEIGKNMLDHFNLSLVKEIVIHLAIDTTLNNYALMWNKYEKKSLNLGGVSYEYYPLGFAGLGNFYFTKKLVGLVGTPEVGLIKFYGEAFKHLSKQHTAKSPFLESRVANALLSSLFNASRVSAKKFEEMEQFNYNCKVIRLACQDLCQKNGLSARLEFLIRTIWPDKNVYGQSIEIMRKIIAEKMPITPQQLTIIDMDTIKGKIQDYMFPALLTIELAVAKRLSSLRCEETYGFNLTEYTSVAAAECVLGFMLYGCAISTRVNKRHCNALARSLNCVVTAYSGSRFVPGPLFTLDEVSGQLLYHTLNEKVLNYLVPEKLRFWQGCDLVNLMCIANNFQDTSVIKQREVCNNFLRAIFSSVTGRHSNSFVKATHEILTRFSNPRFVNSITFVRELRSKTGWDKKVVGNIIRVIEETLASGGNSEAFFDLLVDCLETLLWTQSEYAVFPTVSNSVLIIVPLVHLSTYKNSVFYDGYIQMLAKIYRKFGKAGIRLRKIQQGLRQVLNSLPTETYRLERLNLKRFFNSAQYLTAGVDFDTSKLFVR